jgi:hypothetical protein
MATAQKLNATLRKFIERQPLFFVATADIDGRVNVSPKGMNTLRIIDDQTIRWLNLTGSGNETAAHVQSTGRMTLMFCAFEGDALILRTYGTAIVRHPHDKDWTAIASDFPPLAGSRQIFDLSVDLVQTSCGTGVPIMNFQASRGEEELVPFYADMGEDGVRDYWNRKNTQTIDNKPTGILGSI